MTRSKAQNYAEASRLASLETYQRSLKDRVGRGRDHWFAWVRRWSGPNVKHATFDDWMAVFINVGHITGDEAVRALMDPVGDPINAWVENNAWIARCECGGQEVVDPEELRFYCFGCLNIINGGRSRPLNFGNWRAIEDVLTARPNPLNRCMYAIQNPVTLSFEVLEDEMDLADENEVHDLPRVRPSPRTRMGG